MDSGIVLTLCKQYGPTLALPARSILSGPVLMAAIAENESSFGKDTKPRYEQAYDRGRRYDRNEQKFLLDKFGHAAACSYGPWQTLPCNALAFTPNELNESPDAAARAFVADMNHRVLPHSLTLSEMAQIYNSGRVSKTPLPGVVRYMNDLQANYAKWFPKLHAEAVSAPSYA